MTVPYRTIAERTLEQAADKLNSIPNGVVNSQEVIARSAQAQAVATVAVAQALLEIGDVLRAAFPHADTLRAHDTEGTDR